MKINISHINNMHGDWKRSLDFYRQELGILKERLTEIAAKNTGKDTMLDVEHFENQFEIQQDNMVRLKHNIKQNMSGIRRELQETNGGYADADLAERYQALGEQFQQEEKTIRDLRHEFNRFAMERM